MKFTVNSTVKQKRPRNAFQITSINGAKDVFEQCDVFGVPWSRLEKVPNVILSSPQPQCTCASAALHTDMFFCLFTRRI